MKNYYKKRALITLLIVAISRSVVAADDATQRREIAKMKLRSKADRNGLPISATRADEIVLEQDDFVQMVLSGRVDRVQEKLRNEPPEKKKYYANKKNKAKASVLMLAAVMGNLPMAQELVEGEAKLNYSLRDGNNLWNAIDWGAISGDIELVKYLYKKGARFTDADRVMTQVMQEQPASVAEFLLDHGAHIEAEHGKNRYTSLMLAAASNRTDLITLFATRGANVNATDASGNSALVQTIDGKEDDKSIATLDALLSNSKDSNNQETLAYPLYLAAELGLVRTIRLLCTEYGADPNFQTSSHNFRLKFTPLIIASLEGHTPAVETLCQLGATVDKSICISGISREKFTALEAASVYGHVATIRALLARDALASLRGMIAFLQPKTVGDIGESVRILLEAGAPADQDYNGYNLLLSIALQLIHGNPIMHAQDAISLLIDYGADINKVGPEGVSPLSITTGCNIKKLEKLLTQANEKQQVIIAHKNKIAELRLLLDIPQEAPIPEARTLSETTQLLQDERRSLEDQLVDTKIAALNELRGLCEAPAIARGELSATTFEESCQEIAKLQKDAIAWFTERLQKNIRLLQKQHGIATENISQEGLDDEHYLRHLVDVQNELNSRPLPNAQQTTEDDQEKKHARLLALTADDFEQLAIIKGYKRIRQKGSHRMYRNEAQESLVIPYHGNTEIARGLASKLLKQLHTPLSKL